MKDIAEYPQYLTTKEDYEYVRNNFDRKYWMRDFQSLLADAYVDIPVGEFGPILTLEKDPSGKEMKTIVSGVSNAKILDTGKKKNREYLKQIFDLMKSTDEYETVTSEKFSDLGELRVYTFGDDKYYIITNPILNPKCKLLQLGYTIEEVMDILFEEEEKEAHEKVEKAAKESMDRLRKESGLSDEEFDELVKETDAELNK